MIDKRVSSLAEAMAGINDGAVVLVGGFGDVGHPMALIDALLELGRRDLTIVCNNAGRGEIGLPRLMKAGQLRKLICTFPRTSEICSQLFATGKLEVEIVPQGTLAERLRAAGAGIGGFFTRTGARTLLAHGKEERIINDEPYLLETPLHGDVALIEAWTADRWGNLTYRQSGRNFNPVMAAAATLTIAQVVEFAPGPLDPECVVTPGIYVDRVVLAAPSVGGMA